MIRKLRRKLIAACMFSLALVLFVILGGINLVSYRKVAADADAILAVLGENDGAFPKPRQQKGVETAPDAAQQQDKKPSGVRGMSPETPYESRFFSVLLDEDGQVVKTETGQIAAVDDEEAASCALSVMGLAGDSGFFGEYRYLRCAGETGTRIIFLDCGRSLSGFRMTLFSSVALALVGLGCVLALLLVLSGRIIRPVVESYEKQRRFITDAGHELKTPLTIISADTDLAEMECGENQWLTDIRRQAQRLTGLTHDLIFLSRMEEEQKKMQMIEFPLSDVAEEMAQSFLAPAMSQGKTLSIRIQPMLAYTGDEKAIRQLLSILLDNALKYSPTGGQLTVSLEKQGRSLTLAVSNTTAQPMKREQLCRLFDRFYRADESRNSQTGGYGLGLSIAKGIVLAHRGKIRAESPDAGTLCIVVSLTA